VNERNRYDQGPRFVPALRDPDPPKPVIVEVDPREIVTLPPAALVQSETTGSHEDRAKAFQIVSFPISVAFGLAALILAVVGWAVPVVSLAALLIFWVAFLGWWLLAWVVHNLFSADGIALLHVLAGWSYLRREQADRHRRYRQ
jgi:hypothetical protein